MKFAAILGRHRISILFFFLVLTVAGLFTVTKLPVALFPSMEFPRIIVNVDAGDMPVDKMIIEVTKPLEYALRKVPGVNGIRSISNSGTAELSINFPWGHDMPLALLQVQSAINQTSSLLPKDVSANALRVDISGYPMFGISLTSKTKDMVDIRDFANYNLLPLLNSIDGVASVEVLGGQTAEFQIKLNPILIKQYGLQTSDIVNVIALNNSILSVGRIEDRYRLYLVMSGNTRKSLDDLNHIVVKYNTGKLLMLGDIAEITMGTTPAWTRVTSNNTDAVLLNIRQQIGANTVAIAGLIKEKLADFAKSSIKSIHIQTYYDQSKLIKAAAGSVKEAILIGAFLAALVVLIFLRNWRLTVIVVLIIPCVIATTVLILYAFNMSFNIMTLGGIAAAVGLVIDDAVVMVEHIARRLIEQKDRGKDSPSIIANGMEMLRPLTGSSLATIIIFVPLSFLNGITGSLFKALALTMTASLLISYFFTLLVVPLLSESLLRKIIIHHEDGKFLSLLKQKYSSLMQPILATPKLLIIPILGFSLIGYAAYSKVESGFMPNMDEGTIAIDYMTKSGTSLTETDRILRQVESIITSIPEVNGYSRRTGLLFGGSITPPNRGDFFISLKDHPRRNIEEIMNELREKITLNVPGIQFGIAQLIGDMIGDLTSVPQPIEIKIFGGAQTALMPIAQKISEQISKVRGVVEIKNGIIYSGDSIELDVNPLKAATYGLDVDGINNQVKNQIAGNYVNTVLDKNKTIPIRVMSKDNLFNTVNQLNNLVLIGPNNTSIPLKQVASIEIKTSQTQQIRESLKPMIAVTARISGRGLGSTMDEIKQIIKKDTLPQGMYIEYGGLYKEQQKSFKDLIIVFISAEFLVVLLLLVLYENISIVLSILGVTLFTLPGMFLGLYLTGVELNISSMMGMTMVIGMVTEIAIFYFSELILLPKYSKSELIKVGVMRMRPIFMTSIIAVLALLPLALGLGVGSEMQQPLAITIISGLIVAVPLILIVMPVMYSLLNRLFNRQLAN